MLIVLGGFVINRHDYRKKCIEAKGLSSTGNAQKLAFSEETEAYNSSKSRVRIISPSTVFYFLKFVVCTLGNHIGTLLFMKSRDMAVSI